MFDTAIQLNQKLDEAFVNRGIAYHHLNLIASAICSFDDAIEINSKNL